MRRTVRSEKNIELVRNVLENDPNLTGICIIKNMGGMLNEDLQK